MTEQEEIREGIARGLAHNDIIEWEELTRPNRQHYLTEADRVRNYLHSQGVVLRVDRELPNTVWNMPLEMRDKKVQQDMLKWHNDSLEPLINRKEGGNG